MEKPVELQSLKKIDQVRRFSNKELRLTEETMGLLLKSNEYYERSERSHTAICRELLERHIILSSMRTYVIVNSIMNKLCCRDSGCRGYRRKEVLLLRESSLGLCWK